MEIKRISIIYNPALIAKLYTNGLTSPTIATKLGCCKRTVLYWLHKQQIPIQRIGGRVNNILNLKLITHPDKEMAYFLGFIAGDGCVRVTDTNSEQLRIKLHYKDKEILVRFKQVFKSNAKIHHWSNNQVSITVSQRGLLLAFKKWNIVPRKTYCSKFPKLAKNLRRHYIAGLFDADGCISSKVDNQGYTRVTHLTITNYRVSYLKQLQKELLTYGIKSNIYKEQPTYARLVIYRGYVDRLYKYLYNDRVSSLSRKRNKFKKVVIDLQKKPLRNVWNRK